MLSYQPTLIGLPLCIVIMFSIKRVILSLTLFALCNGLLYLFIWKFASVIPFNEKNYWVNAHHFIPDSRILFPSTDLFNALGQYDAQWYLKIGKTGYPSAPTNMNMKDKSVMDGLTYAFFPLYPIGISLTNLAFTNIELSAFVFSNLLLLFNFVSILVIISKWSSQTVALKTAFLLFFFPFSIFFRSYFSESLFLFFLLWFFYYLKKKDWLLTSIFLSLLSVTRPTGLFLFPVYLFSLYGAMKKRNVSFGNAAALMVVSVMPFCFWLLFCFIQTGNPLYWATVQSAWFPTKSLLNPLYHNINQVRSFFALPLHDFHNSRIDVLTVFGVLALLVFSWKKLPKELWWGSFCLWFFPLLSKDMISFSRYQIVSFPLFLYVAQSTSMKTFIFLFIACFTVLLMISLYFVNWYWVG